MINQQIGETISVCLQSERSGTFKRVRIWVQDISGLKLQASKTHLKEFNPDTTNCYKNFNHPHPCQPIGHVLDNGYKNFFTMARFKFKSFLFSVFDLCELHCLTMFNWQGNFCLSTQNSEIKTQNSEHTAVCYLMVVT